MSLKPLADRVVVEPLESEQRTSGGIIIPDNAKEKPQQGTIVAAGPGRSAENGERIALTVKTGDTVLYGKYSGTEITVEGKKLLIMKESDLFAIMK